MAEAFIRRVIETCCRYARTVTFSALLVSIAASVFVADNIRIDTNSSNLIADNLPWRQRQKTFDAAFPSIDRLIVVVVEGATPELAERGAARLSRALKGHPKLFLGVTRPDGGPFFARHGLLYKTPAEIRETLDQIIRAQPMLGTLARDESLRGVMASMRLALDGARRGETTSSDLAPALSALLATLRRVADGRPAFLSWLSLITSGNEPRDTAKRLILVQPVLDFGALSPAAAAADAIRQTAARLGLDAAAGVRVRLTGQMALADEEFASLAKNIEITIPAMIGALALLLWSALRLGRIILPILATLLMGLAITAAFGLAVLGQFNLISIAFTVLFLGLGIDFGIQFSVRYRAARHERDDLTAALVAAGAGIGRSLVLAAFCTSIGFYAFGPTDYKGVSDLGLIAGTGMLIALVLTLTVLPAMLRLTRPGGEPAPVGFAFLLPMDSFLRRHRKTVLGLSAMLGLAALALAPLLQFDFNPLNLKAQDSESVATLRGLMDDGLLTLDTIDVLAPSLDAARVTAKRLKALPEVARAITLADFVPTRQGQKLAMIKDAVLLLGPTLSPFDKAPPPRDSDLVRALTDTAADLRDTAPRLLPGEASRARALARVLDRLAAGDAGLRAAARRALEPGLRTMLSQVRDMLRAGPVTLDSLPAATRAAWLADDGRARIEVTPKGDSGDNQTLIKFVDAVQAVVPQATGAAVGLRESSRMVVAAFQQAGLWALISITLLLTLVFRSFRDVLLTFAPLGLAFVFTIATCVMIGLDLNFANIIALPLLFGIGVAFNIYFVTAWRDGLVVGMLASSQARAVLFSALTTAMSFGSLWLSGHPGTASMGKLLMISLGWTLVTCFVILPPLLSLANRRTR